MQIQHKCDFLYVFDPLGTNEKKVTECQTCLPGGGHCTEYGEEETGEHCGEEGCEPPAEEYYCPLNATFDGQKSWGVCDDGCLDEDKGTLSSKTNYMKSIEEHAVNHFNYLLIIIFYIYSILMYFLFIG